LGRIGLRGLHVKPRSSDQVFLKSLRSCSLTAARKTDEAGSALPEWLPLQVDFLRESAAPTYYYFFYYTAGMSGDSGWLGVTTNVLEQDMTAANMIFCNLFALSFEKVELP
jgi:hypothetical protein